MKKDKNNPKEEAEKELPKEEIFNEEQEEETPQINNENADQAIDEYEAMKQELEELKDSHLRLRAEYDNYRKRTLKEKSDLIKYGGEKTITGFLGIMDDLELAIANIQKAESIEGVVEGVELIHSKFISALKAQGVNAMEVVGEEFDADKHEAIAMVPTEKKEQKGRIIDCIQTGYTLNDKVIRHPKVVVGQ